MGGPYSADCMTEWPLTSACTSNTGTSIGENDRRSDVKYLWRVHRPLAVLHGQSLSFSFLNLCISIPVYS